MDLILTPNQKKVIEDLADVDEILFGGQAGGGKALALDTPIPTKTGLKTMETIQIGDIVFTDDGNYTEVIAVSDPEKYDSLAISFDSGEEIIADIRHTWKTYREAKDGTYSYLKSELRMTKDIKKGDSVFLSGYFIGKRNISIMKYIKKIKPVGEKLVRCIQVANPSGMYVVGKTFIPTHNSELLLTFALMRRLQLPGSVGIMFRRKFTDLDKSLIRKTKMDLYATVYNTTCLECGKKLTLNTDKVKIYDASDCTCTLYKPKDNTNKERLLIRPAWPSMGAKWSGESRTYTFKNGSIQEFGYIDKEDDLMNYRSGEWDDCCWDEISSFPFDWYQTIKGRSRAKGDWKFLIRSATNPGGPGHKEIKNYFVDVAKDKVYKTWDAELQDYTTRYFMTAKLEDNNIYKTYFPDQFRRYNAWLSQLPETEKQHQKYGNWDFNPDSAFMELDRRVHGVKKDMPVPDWAEIVMAYDWGFGAPFSIGWYWVDHDGRLWRFKEWYGGSDPRTGGQWKGLRMADSDVAKGILEREKKWGLSGRRIMRVATPDCFSKKPDTKGGGQGPSTADVFAEEGVYMNPGDSDRRKGIAQVHERLKKPEDALPMLMVYESCIHFWRTMPELRLEEPGLEDVDQKGQEDHVYDEVKLLCCSRPIVPQEEKPTESLFQKVLRKVTTFKKDADVLEEIFD